VSRNMNINVNVSVEKSVKMGVQNKNLNGHHDPKL
jgi:hypothetical protein